MIFLIETLCLEELLNLQIHDFLNRNLMPRGPPELPNRDFQNRSLMPRYASERSGIPVSSSQTLFGGPPTLSP